MSSLSSALLRVLRGGVFAVAIATVAAVHAQQPARILVMPFENQRRDNRIFWLGEAAAIVLTDDLTAMGASAITRAEREQAFDRLQVPPAATLTDATIIRIGQLVGADQVVVGTLQLDDTLIVRARGIVLDAGKIHADVVEQGPLDDLYAILERVARKITPNAAASNARVPSHPPLPAFENYVKGLLAETPATSLNYLNTALQLHPSFDRARLALWDVYSDQGEYEQALAAVSGVAADSPYARRARFLSGLSAIELAKYDEAFAIFKALADAKPEPPVLNNIGVVQLRRGSTPQTGVPTYYFQRAADGDKSDSDYLFNLGYAYWLDRDTQATIYWLREAVRRRPTDGAAHYVLGVALATAGNTAEAAREKELARRLSSAYAQWEKRPPNDPVPRGLERIKTDVALPHAHEIETRLMTSEQRDQQELVRFHLESGRRLYEREIDREAAAELNRALYLSPYLAEAHLMLGRIHLRNGRIKEAIDAFKVSLWSTETAEAHAALGEAFRQDKDVVSARAEAERALAIDPSSAEAKTLLARLDAR